MITTKIRCIDHHKQMKLQSECEISHGYMSEYACDEEGCKQRVEVLTTVE